jgi:tricorn protease
VKSVDSLEEDSVLFTKSLLALVGIFVLSTAAYSQTKLLRFPDIRGDRVVFTYAGDLWTASFKRWFRCAFDFASGVEVFGKFSPDGKWIAFTGQYDGDEQVYVVPTSGGEPRQLTFYPARGPLAPRWGWDNQVFGWSKDSKRIIFRSLRDSWSLPIARLFTVSVDGGAATALPMPTAGSGDLSPNNDEIVYSPQSRDFRSEKRYGGGQANQLYIFNLNSNAAKRITEGPRATRDAMWIGDTIFFNSDRDGHFNLYAYSTANGRTTQITTAVHGTCVGPVPIMKARSFMNERRAQVMDARTKKSTPISINVPDEGNSRRPSRVSAANLIESVGLSPKGERALFAARGDIFTAPIEKGPTRNLTDSSARTTSGRVGRLTDRRSRLSPTRVVKKRFI